MKHDRSTAWIAIKKPTKAFCQPVRAIDEVERSNIPELVGVRAVGFDRRFQCIKMGSKQSRRLSRHEAVV
jgi:hypothetical protein